MALYAIGDIQGCFKQLLALLELINFNPDIDQLWFTGDIVNRGLESLETLRFIKSLGDSAVTVLGNHDLHLLALYITGKKPNNKDTLDSVLAATDRQELLDWLLTRPLIHKDENYCIVHAGLPPEWDVEQARTHALQIETILRGCTVGPFFSNMYGDTPSKWAEQLDGWERIRFITNCLTRIRFCDLDGNLEFKQKGKPGTQKKGYVPWFEHPNRRSRGTEIIFGHWSTLGFKATDGVHCIDTGCLWGNQLTALRLDNKEMRRFSLDCPCSTTISKGNTTALDNI